MNLTKRLEAVEAAVAKELGELDYKFIWRNSNESQDDAIKRAGLTDWRGQVFLFSWIDSNLRGQA